MSEVRKPEVRGEVLDQVRRILIDNLKIDREPYEIDPDVPLFGTGLGLDSVDAVELLVALESALRIQMPEETQAPVHLRTVNTVVDFILRHRGHPNAEPITGAPSEARAMDALRTATAYSRLDEMLAVRIRAPDPFEAVDPVASNDLFMRDGQMRQGLFLDDEGHPLGDVYVAHDDDSILLLVEGMGADTLDSYLRDGLAANATIEPLYREREIVSVHGPYAWELLSEVLGEDIVALPYLGFFALSDDTDGICFRGGKTGEFGYDILLPRDRADAFVTRLEEAGRDLDLEPLDATTLAQAKREVFFFDPAPFSEKDVTPLELQLRWRCSKRKDYRGSAALRARSPRARLTCLTSAAPLPAGSRVTSAGARVGEIVHSGHAPRLGAYVAHALMDLSHAEVGLEHVVSDALVRAVPPPVVANESLRVDPRRDLYRERADGEPGA